MSLISNRSHIHGKIPGDWKSVNVIPIFKIGWRGNKNNYRPVSLTSVLGMLLESIIRGDQVQKFYDESKLIYSSHHGFIKGKSCLTNLIEFFYWIFLMVGSMWPTWFYITRF